MRQTKTFEEALEDNLLRPLVRDHMEVIPLARAAGAGRIGSALQVACARGDSTLMHQGKEEIGADGKGICRRITTQEFEGRREKPVAPGPHVKKGYRTAINRIQSLQKR